MVAFLSLLTTIALAKPKVPKPVDVPVPPETPAVVEVAPPAPVDPLADRPTVGAAASWSVPVPETATLSNGASVWVLQQPSLPLVSVVVAVPGGAALDVGGPSGTQWMLDRMLSQGAGSRDGDAFNAALETLGASVDVATGRSSSSITLTVRKENLGAALDLLADMVLRPTLNKKVVKRERELALSSLELGKEDPVTVATRVAWSQWFGDAHPYGQAPAGTVDGLRKVSRGTLKKRLKTAWNASGATFTVAGDVTREEIVGLLEPRLGAPWKGGKRLDVTVASAPAHDNAPVVFVDNPGAAQTMFYVVFPGSALATPDTAPARVGTIALGGTFTSRLNALLREKRGYTYGVRASEQSLPGAGVLVVSTRIRTDATGPAMKDLLSELARIREGVTPEEVVKARAAYRQDLVETMESREGVAGTFAGWHVAGKSPDALAQALVATDAVTQDAVKAAMAAYDPAKALLVLVGDRGKVEVPLREAGITAFVEAKAF